MSAKNESYICLECGRLAGMKEPTPCYYCGAQNFMSVDRYVKTWPEPYLLMQEIAMRKQGRQTSFKSTTS